jgi:Sulfotransferase domain
MIDKERIAILAGMPRAATTFLYHNLNLHPEIYIPYRRKTNYFSLHHEKGEGWFLSHFKDAPDAAMAIDTETLSFINKGLNSPELIKQFKENTKIILCIRDPAAWVVSLYEQIATFDNRIPDFEKFLAGDYTLVEDGVGTIFHMKGGDICTRVGEYEKLFPDSILLLKFRDVTEFPLESLKRIEQFLGVSSFYSAENVITKKINSSGRKHNKFLNKVLRNEHVIASIRALLPRKAVLAIRWMFDGVLSGGDGKSSISQHSEKKDKMLFLAKEHYKSDIKALEKYIQ